MRRRKIITMDPCIMKLLEEDEDESMHSGADVDAFQAALNRDIGGDVSTSQPHDSDSGKDCNKTSSQPVALWKNPSQDENKNFHSQQGLESARLQEQDLQQMELKQHGSVAENEQQNVSAVSKELNRQPLQQKQSQDDGWQGQSEEKTSSQLSQTTGIQISEKNPVPTPERLQSQVGEPQYSKIQKMNNQQAIGSEQASNPMNRSKQVAFASLLPALVPHLDKDRAMQLHTLYGKLKKNEIIKDVFVRHMRDIVGDQMLRLAVNKMQSQMVASQFQSQASARQKQLRMPSISAAATQFGDTHSFAQINQKGINSPSDPTHVPAASVHLQAGSSYPIIENSAQKSRELVHQSGSHGIHSSLISSSTPNTINQERVCSSTPVQGLSKQQQQHLHFPQTSFSMYGSGSGSYHPYSGANVNPPGSSLKTHPHDSQMRQVAHHQSMESTPSGGASQAMNIMNPPKLERQNSMNDSGKVQGGSISHSTNNSALQQSSVPWQASANKEQSSGPLPMTYVKPEPIDQGAAQPNKLHSSTPQGLSAAQAEPGSMVPGTLKDGAFEKQPPRMGFFASTSIVPSNSVSLSPTTQLDPNVPLSSRMSSVTSPAGVNARTPPKKPSVGQKKPLEPPGSSPSMPSKKQKVSGAFSDQSIEQLNDVTAVSGVNLREEEEELFAGPKEDSQVSEASRRAVQEEEERLILQKTPLQKRLAEIMAKCGLKNMSNDVERCLSLCVEERLRELLCKLIRLSKQRVDAEKTRHRTIITSDVRQQIMIMNRKAREEWEKKQAEAEKLRKINEPEPEGDSGVDGDNETDDGCVKSVKVNKEEDDKMRTTAANVAARAAVGGHDMLSKWQLMAEQARQKREGGTDVASGSQAGNANRKPISTSGRNKKDNQDVEKRSQTATGSGRKFGRSQVMVSPTKAAHAISVKDVIAILEGEPQKSKSTLIYRLYEKVRSDAAAA